jgi:hypothetical protein
MDLKNIITQLENGLCPAELNFSLIPSDPIDWDKVRYNTFFKSHEFYADKFPEVVHKLPAFDKIIDDIVEMNKDNSPLKEITEKKSLGEIKEDV